MKYGARNQIDGVVTSIKKGNVMAQVNIDIPKPSKMGSVMTVDSVNDLDLKVGDKVKIVVKAISVLLVKE
jgi:molybdopterin-binding protein